MNYQTTDPDIKKAAHFVAEFCARGESPDFPSKVAKRYIEAYDEAIMEIIKHRESTK